MTGKTIKCKECGCYVPEETECKCRAGVTVAIGALTYTTATTPAPWTPWQTTDDRHQHDVLMHAMRRLTALEKARKKDKRKIKRLRKRVAALEPEPRLTITPLQAMRMADRMNKGAGDE